MTLDNLTVGEKLGVLAAIDVGTQLFFGLIASYFQTEKFFDLVGAPNYWLLSFLALVFRTGPWDTISPRQIGNCVCIGIWAIRLSSFLLIRVLKAGSDRRFDNVKKVDSCGSLLKFLGIVWMAQALWIFVTGLPAYIVNLKSDDPDEITASIAIGWAVFAIGFLFETIADEQKKAWRAKPENKGKWIDVGLWGICQHPNYVGEMLIWVGIYIANVSALKDWEHVGVISPLFIFVLLRFGSGVPPLQAYAVKKWGTNPDWQKYHSSTPKLLFCFKPCMGLKNNTPEEASPMNLDEDESKQKPTAA